MAYTLKIATIDKTSLLLAGSLSVTRRTGHKNDCSFSVVTTSAYLPDVGQDVQVLDGATVIFGGVIQSIQHEKLEAGYGAGKKIQLSITSNGYGSIPSRRTITNPYDQKSAGYVVTDLIASQVTPYTPVLSSEGITAGTISTGADPVGDGEYDAVCKSCGEILNEMAAASGYKWYIDDSKALYFVADDAEVAAAHDIVEGGAFTDFEIESYEKSLDGYANKVFVRGGIGDDGYAIQTYEEDTTEQTARAAIEGGTGVYGTVINDGNIDLLADATTAATNALKKFGIIPRTLTIKSWTLDWIAGTKLKVNLPTFGISSDTYYLIEEVTLQDNGNQNLHCTLQCSVRKSDNFSTQGNQTGMEYLEKVVSKAKESGGISNTYIDSTGAITQTNLYVDIDWPAGAKAKSVLVDTDDPTIDDGSAITTATTLTWASARQVNVTGTTIITLPDPTTDKNIAGSAVDHDGIVMFCIHNANAANGMVTVTDGTLTKYLYPQESVTVRTGVTTAWEVV
ncbi:MAG: hypothetical protein WC365_00900 [Candidatus Babeliales bacterium]|jgi:hypothetical protein